LIINASWFMLKVRGAKKGRKGFPHDKMSAVATMKAAGRA
jgi:hypothetical protein